MRGLALRSDTLYFYTDGSSYSGPRVGGMGIVMVTVNADGTDTVEEVPAQGHEGATNNQMELKACVEALRFAAALPNLRAFREICIYTDSLYVANQHKTAMFTWPEQDWRTEAGRPIANLDLWQGLIGAIRRVRKRVQILWVKGHKKHPYNEAADKAAKASAKGLLKPPLAVVHVRRKLTKQIVRPGCVPMRGQTMSIRIDMTEYLGRQRGHKYKYEVLSEGEWLGSVDYIYSDDGLYVKAGHHYEVTVNNDQKYPQVVVMLGELERPTPKARRTKQQSSEG
jgi:ribonuclease HI